MASVKPVVVVTGIAGNLGSRLLPLLGDFSVIGVDLIPPQTDLPLQFERLDVGEESSTRALFELLRDTQPVSVVHLAFVIDPVRTGVLDSERMWQINVAGTARVMEAVTEANRTGDFGIKQFIFPSSVSAYGSNLPRPATEDSVMAGHTLPYAIHKKQSDEVVQQRAHALRGCSVYIHEEHVIVLGERILERAEQALQRGRALAAERIRRIGLTGDEAHALAGAGGEFVILVLSAGISMPVWTPGLLGELRERLLDQRNPRLVVEFANSILEPSNCSRFPV